MTKAGEIIKEWRASDRTYEDLHDLITDAMAEAVTAERETILSILTRHADKCRDAYHILEDYQFHDNDHRVVAAMKLATRAGLIQNAICKIRKRGEA
jgi:hypothetical protein